MRQQKCVFGGRGGGWGGHLNLVLEGGKVGDGAAGVEVVQDFLHLEHLLGVVLRHYRDQPPRPAKCMNTHWGMRWLAGRLVGV